MFIFSEKEQLRFAVVNVYKNGVYGYPCKDRSEAEWRAAMLSGLAYRITVKPKLQNLLRERGYKGPAIRVSRLDLRHEGA